MIRLARYQSTTGAERSRNLREERATAEQRLVELKKIQAGMVLTAPRDGTVIPQWQHMIPKDESDALESWDGWTLHTENVGTSFVRGQEICKIGDLSNTEAHLMIDQSDIKFIQRGQDVQLLLDSRAARSIRTSVASISLSDSDEIASNVSHEFGGSIQTKQDNGLRGEDLNERQNVRPENAVYEAIADVPDTLTHLEDGIRGTAKISIRPSTLAGRMHRFLQKTFRFDL